MRTISIILLLLFSAKSILPLNIYQFLIHRLTESMCSKCLRSAYTSALSYACCMSIDESTSHCSMLS